MATSKIKKSTQIIRTYDTGTTSAGGNIKLTIPTGYADAQPIAAYIVNQSASVKVASLGRMAQNFYIRVTDGANVVANTSVDYCIFWANYTKEVS